MNQRTGVIITLVSIFLLNGCQRGIHTPTTQLKKDNQTASHHSKVDLISQNQPPEQIQPTKPTTVIDPQGLPPLEENNYQVSVDFVDRRLQSYRQKLEQWEKYDSQTRTLNLNREMPEQTMSCFRNLKKISSEYSLLRDILVAGENASLLGGMTSDEIQVLQESDIDFIEGFCGNLLNDGKKLTALDQASSVSTPGKLVELIRHSFQNEEYEQVVQLWLEIPEEKVNQVPIATKRMYGRSLMYLHQEKKAASVYEQILAEANKTEKETTNILYLHTVLSNLYVASRNYSAAADQYQKILETFQDALKMKNWAETQQKILTKADMRGQILNDYSAIIRNYMGYVPSKDGYKPIWQINQFMVKYPDFPGMTNVDQMKSTLTLKAERWFNKTIADIDQLQQQRQFNDGLLLLETIARDTIDPEQVKLVQRKSIELNATKTTVQENLKIEQLTALQDSWSEILTLVGEGKHDEALALLNLMRDSYYSDEVATKIEEVSLLAAKEHSLKAAKLFQLAMQTDDSSARRRLLVQSSQLLQKITLKYPETLIIDKVHGYIQRVNSEMNKLEPGHVNKKNTPLVIN
jgi:tetratricopeptide (TPR) repeat protein